MRKVFFLLVAIVTTMIFCVDVSAGTIPKTKHYLDLGADPFNSEIQPTEEQELVVSNSDLCDSGWSTGSGKKVSGCYPKGTTAIRRKIDHVLVAIYYCGNEPSDTHVVEGKVIAVSSALPDAPKPVGLPAADMKPQGLPAPQVSANATVNFYEAQSPESPQPAYKESGHHWWVVAVIAGGGAVAVIVVRAMHRGNNKSTGSLNTGGAQFAPGFNFGH